MRSHHEVTVKCHSDLVLSPLLSGLSEAWVGTYEEHSSFLLAHWLYVGGSGAYMLCVLGGNGRRAFGGELSKCGFPPPLLPRATGLSEFASQFYLPCSNLKHSSLTFSISHVHVHCVCFHSFFGFFAKAHYDSRFLLSVTSPGSSFRISWLAYVHGLYHPKLAPSLTV